MFEFKDLTGTKIDKLYVVKLHHKKQLFKKDGKKAGHKYYWLCKCDCGNYTVLSTQYLLSKYQKSCGCIHIKHGLSHTRLYRIYIGMKSRCYNKKSPQYKDYGERGITICNEWLEDFKKFYEWAISNNYSSELSIDRINVNGSYEPSNCRWATPIEQYHNTRITNYINGVDIPIMYKFKKDIRERLNSYLVG